MLVSQQPLKAVRQFIEEIPKPIRDSMVQITIHQFALLHLLANHPELRLGFVTSPLLTWAVLEKAWGHEIPLEAQVVSPLSQKTAKQLLSAFEGVSVPSKAIERVRRLAKPGKIGSPLSLIQLAGDFTEFQHNSAYAKYRNHFEQVSDAFLAIWPSVVSRSWPATSSPQRLPSSRCRLG